MVVYLIQMEQWFSTGEGGAPKEEFYYFKGGINLSTNFKCINEIAKKKKKKKIKLSVNIY